MAPTDIDTVAKCFLVSAHEVGDYLTNLKLQKLVYYAQAWYLALTDEPLFDGEFEAWVHGPVNYHLYKKYQHHEWRPIDDNPNKPKLAHEIKEFLDSIGVTN